MHLQASVKQINAKMKRSTLIIFTSLLSTTFNQNPHPTPTKDQVFSSLRKSLVRSLPPDSQYHTVSSYLPQSQLSELQQFIDQHQETFKVKSKKILQIFKYSFQDLSKLSKRGLGRGIVLDFIEEILKAIYEVLNNNLKEAFIKLMTPLMDLTLALHPLPEYQLDLNIRDGAQSMRQSQHN